MSFRPPVSARFLPSRQVLGTIARFAFWPLAFVAGRALDGRHSLVLTFALILALLLTSTMTRWRRTERAAIAVGAAVVAIASFEVARSVLAALHLGPVIAGAALSAIVTGSVFARAMLAVGPGAKPSLDADALALVPIAGWLAITSLLTRWGAESVHMHVWLPALSNAVGAIAGLAAVLALVTLARQRTWIRRVYRDEAAPLKVAPVTMEAVPETVPEMSSLAADAVIVVASERLQPYRDKRSHVARVPSSPRGLLRRYARGALASALVCALSALALFMASRARLAHGDASASVPTALPPVERCGAKGWPTVRFVALTPLSLVDAQRVADRYRRAGIPDVRMEPPFPLDERFIDRARNQLIGEDVVRAARRAYPRDGTVEREIVIVLTDRDMYLGSMPWRFAFAATADDVAVVSLARMDPAFPFSSKPPYVPRPPACTEELHARAFKMITRRILIRACGDTHHGGHKSVLRPSILGLGDLDEIDEASY